MVYTYDASIIIKHKHKHKDVYTCDKHKHKVTYASSCLRYTRFTHDISISISISIRKWKLNENALKVKNSDLEKKATELQETVDFCEEDISAVKMNTKKNEIQIEELKKYILYMEAYSRRENVKFIGIPEKINSEDDMEQDLPSQQIENTKDVVYKFLEEHLQIENPNVTIEFQRIHRLGKPATGKTRPIIARFLRYKDKERIMEQAFAIFDDIPKELYESRKKQLNKFKEARKKGLNAYFSKTHPDKLFVEGEFIALDEPLK